LRSIFFFGFRRAMPILLLLLLLLLLADVNTSCIVTISVTRVCIIKLTVDHRCCCCLRASGPRSRRDPSVVSWREELLSHSCCCSCRGRSLVAAKCSCWLLLLLLLIAYWRQAGSSLNRLSPARGSSGIKTSACGE
jgi:hypothetical protein